MASPSVSVPKTGTSINVDVGVTIPPNKSVSRSSPYRIRLATKVPCCGLSDPDAPGGSCGITVETRSCKRGQDWFMPVSTTATETAEEGCVTSIFEGSGDKRVESEM